MWFAPLFVAGGVAVAARNIYRRIKQRQIPQRVDSQSTGASPGTSVEKKSGDTDGTVESVQALEIAQDQTIRDVSIGTLASATAVIHVGLGTPLFLLNGIGFAGLLAAHYLVPDEERFKQYTRDALFGYSGVTIVGYFAVKGVAGGFTDVLGMASKMAELGLMYMLWQDRQAAKLETEQPDSMLLEAGVAPAT